MTDEELPAKKSDDDFLADADGPEEFNPDADGVCEVCQ